jgi:iron(III) transport system permease protein
VIALLVGVPVLVVAGQALSPVGEVWHHLVDTVLWRYVANTLLLGLGVGVGTLVIGTGTAWLCSMCRFPGRALFDWALLLPLAVPTYAIAYTYAGMLEFAGPVQGALREWFGWTRGDYWFPEVRSLAGAVVVMSLVLYPYVYLLARAAFLNQSVCVLEIGRTLGRGPWRSFTDVALPLARPALVGGVALALMEALSDFGTVQYYGVDTFTTGIYRTWFAFGDVTAAGQLSAVLLAFVAVLLFGEQWSRGRARYHHTSGRFRPLPAYRLAGTKGALAGLACLVPLGFGFLLPAGQLLAWTLETWQRTVDARFLALAWNTLSLAALTATLAVVVAVLVAYAVRLGAGPVGRVGARIAGLGYAVPGSVIAVGVLVPFAALDNTLDAFVSAHFGVSTGLVLTGSVAALVFAYLVRFLAVALNAVNAGLAKVTPSMDDAARTLGHGPGGVLWRIHAPIVRGGLLSAALLVFVDVLKELPATLILRPFNFNTLAVRAYELASDEQLAESASAVLAIVAVGIVPVIVLSRAIARARPGAASPLAP